MIIIIRSKATEEVIDKISGKRATDLTPPEYREERKYPAVHSILLIKFILIYLLTDLIKVTELNLIGRTILVSLKII